MPNRWSVRRDGVTKELGELFGLKSPSKFYNVHLRRGDVLIIETGGGGEFRPLAERDEAAKRLRIYWINTIRLPSKYWTRRLRKVC